MKKTLTLALALALICTLVCVFALTSSADEFSFTYSEGVLTIVGSGEMPDYSNDSPAPWAGHKDDTTKVIIPAGITKIGGGAFAHFTSKFDVEVGADVTVIGGDAFAYCTGGIGTMKLPAGLTELKQGVTYSTTVDKVIFAGTVKDFAAVKQGSYQTGTDGAAWEFATALTGSEITPFNDGFENWSGSDNKMEGETHVTQLLVCLDGKLEELFFKYKTKFTFKVSFNGTEVELVPGSNYADMILRFEPCIAATPYIPTNGAKYTIGLKAYIGDTLVYDGVSAEEKFICPVDPVIRAEVYAETDNGWKYYKEYERTDANEGYKKITEKEGKAGLWLNIDCDCGDFDVLSALGNGDWTMKLYVDGDAVTYKDSQFLSWGNYDCSVHFEMPDDFEAPEAGTTLPIRLQFVKDDKVYATYYYDSEFNAAPLTLGRYSDNGFENYSGATVCLIQPSYLGKWENDLFKAVEWTITFDDGENAKTVTLPVFDTYNGGTWGIVRLATCLGEGKNQFIPVKDTEYTVSVKVTLEGVEYTATCPKKFKMPTDPIVPTPATLTIEPYASGDIKGWENWGDPKNTHLLLKLVSNNYFYDDIEPEFLNNKANYTFKVTFNDGEASETHTLVPTSKSGSLLLRFQPCIAEDAFVPTKGKTYTIKLDVYDAAGENLLYTGEGQGFEFNIDPILPENPPTADAAVIATIVVAVALVGMAVAAKKVRV